jgi:hypothetical protein
MNRNRGALLTAIAILFVLLAISDLMKPFHLEGPTTGFVFLGHRTHGLANDILGPLFGIILLAYAYGIWQLRGYAIPLGFAYAAYVLANLLLFAHRNAAHNGSEAVFMIVYLVIALGISWGTPILLMRRRGGASIATS